jgi:micrococcal nuclease
MRPRVLLLLLCPALAWACVVLASEILHGPIPAQVMRVIDGDTIEVRARIWLGQEVEIKVRLDGADAPELKGRCAAERQRAQEARAFVERRIGGQPVALSDVRYDKFGARVVARVADASGANLSDALVARGLAHPYDGKAHRAPWCAAGAE